MKANELRIGNWVTLVGGSDLIHAYKIDVISPLTDVAFDDIQPIPLTEETLLKCGFKSFGEDFKLGHYTFNLERKCFCYGLQAACNEINQNEIKYLHQLQNLYFALTGEELNIEL